MSSLKFSISLVCPEGNHEPIKLPHRELLYIGRSPDTRIVDPRCSRKQLQLTADLNTGDVQVVQLGQNSSALDGVEMIKDKVYTMKPTSTLHILTGCFPQKLDVKKLKESDDKKHRHKSASDVETVNHESSKHRSSSSGSTPKNSLHSSSGSSGYGSSSKSSYSGSESKSSSKPSNKRPSTGDSNNSAAKKQKLNGDSHSGKKSSSKDLSDNMDDSEHMKDVAAKLQLLKASAKTMKTPTKSSTSSSHENPSKSGTSTNKNGPVSKGPAPESRWDQYDTLYVFTAKGLESRRKIAAFDIDGTIITTKSGKVFPTHPGDWRLYYKEIPKKLKKLHEDGYKVVFITNQMGVSKGKTNIDDLKSKFIAVMNEVGIPVQIFVSTKGGLYRKPCPGMWNFLVEKLNGGVEVELSQSFYVGDAAGRPKDWAPKKKKDFSCSDRLFALNIGIEFKTPEEYFIGYPSYTKYTMPEFDPRKISPKTQLFDPADTPLTSGGQEVILLAGFPASGKSFFAKKYLEPKGYIVVNRDTLKTWQKCVALCKDSLKKGKSVVVDNTNPDVESRARYIQAASSCGVPCRCFVFTTSFEHAKHNERFREIIDKTHAAINEMIMNSFKKKYVLPEKKEGFSEVVKVNFVPKFKDLKLEDLYRKFLLEK